MRIPGRRRDRVDEAYEQLPSQIICPVCGLRNDGMARFCRNCGLPLGAPRDPVRGTTSRKADLPSEHGAGIAAVVGLVAAVVVLAGAGFLILRGNSGSGTGTAVGPTPTPAAVASVLPGGSLAPAATGGSLPTRVPVGSPGAGPSGEPVASPDVGTGSPAPLTQPSRQPVRTPVPGPLVGDTDFTCGPADFDDPSGGTWRITEAMWGGRERWDELTIVLRREEGRGRTNIGVEAMSPREAAQVTGLDEAPSGRVIVITFDGDIEIRSPVVATLSERALDYLNIETTSEATYAIVGVQRDGCYRLFSPAWKKGQETAVGDTIRLLLDVRYR